MAHTLGHRVLQVVHLTGVDFVTVRDGYPPKRACPPTAATARNIVTIAAGMFPSTTGTRPVLVVKARALGNTINYKLLGL